MTWPKGSASPRLTGDDSSVEGTEPRLTADGQLVAPRPKDFNEMAERLNADGQTAVLQNTTGREIDRREPPRPRMLAVVRVLRRIAPRRRGAGRPAGRRTPRRSARAGPSDSDPDGDHPLSPAAPDSSCCS